MSEFILYSPSQQLAAYLRTELIGGRWSGTMPGSPTLAKELGVNSKTIWAALGILEEEGILKGQGPGRPRKILPHPQAVNEDSLRIAIFEYDVASLNFGYIVDLRHKLIQMGHTVGNTRKTLTELGMNLSVIRDLVEETAADAWIVCSASREVLEWFSQQDMPGFAMFGRRRRLPIAGVGPNHEAVGRVVARRLIELGHQRIVILVSKSQRAGGPSSPEQAIFEEMASHGIPHSRYNLPDWKDSAEGLHDVLDGLYQVTPPTAFIIDEPFVFHAVKDHLARKGIIAPQHVSLICRDPDPTFSWLQPSVAHTRWDERLIVQRITDWATNISQGKSDIRQTLTKAEFIEGGTIGPVANR
ncbi:MAG: hypothetical protein ACJAVK_002838 [Akkermansiaceae bacterium]